MRAPLLGLLVVVLVVCRAADAGNSDAVGDELALLDKLARLIKSLEAAEAEGESKTLTELEAEQTSGIEVAEKARRYTPPKMVRRNQATSDKSRRGLRVDVGAKDFTVTLEKDDKCLNCRFSIYYYPEDDSSTAFLYPESGPALYEDEAFAGIGRATLSSYVTAKTCYVIGQYIVTPEGKAALGDEATHCTKGISKVLKVAMGKKGRLV